MANSRIPDLAPIYSNSLIGTDLFLLEDMSVSNGISKKLALSELSTYLYDNLRTGSLYGTASWAVSASWANTASYYNQLWLNTGSMYPITSSWAISASNAISSSYAKSASYSISASYAETSSLYLVVSSGFADNAEYARSASFLIYTPGVFNGTASYAITSSRSITSATSSFLQYNSVPNGTASFALTASQTVSSSFLIFNGGNNGTASYAINAGNTLTVTNVTTVKNDYIYREFGPFDCTLLSSDVTASIGAFVVDSDANNPAMIVEAWGDIKMLSTSSWNESGSLTLNLLDADGFPVSIDLDKSTYHNYLTTNLYPTAAFTPASTSSLIVPVYLKGKTTTMGHYSASIFKTGPISFYTGSRPFRMVMKVNSDDFTMD